ncbi:unnamed protein product [Penicillium olsonii]|nr:unnamed protein product [Penicillium olsonii]CAG7927230.1 unnamed protein product [Penicillium olsonii]
MVTGIEAAGLALAILPLFVNQIDGYVRGIEKIKLLRRYRGEFKRYATGLRSQHTILLNTLEDVLGEIVDDEDQIRELIRNPQGEGWRDPDIQKRLRRRLDRNYEVFMGNISGLSELLERLSHKMGINRSDIQTPSTEVWNLRNFRKILSKPIYDDLLVKIDGINTILRTLVDQSSNLQNTKRRKGWSHLLKRYQKARKHADGLFKAIIEGNHWRCQYKSHHCVHVQLQINSLRSIQKHPRSDSDAKSQFQMIFSNTKDDLGCLWTWTEVVFEPWQVEDPVTVASHSRHNDSRSNGQKRPTVQFDVPFEKEQSSKKRRGALSVPPIEDFCSSLCVAKSYVSRQESMGSISDKLDPSVKYTMHAVKVLPKCIPQKPLREILPHISRLERLRIATALASGTIQMCGNWLNSWWDISDVYMAATSDNLNDCKVSLDSLYLLWPVSNPRTRPGPINGNKYSNLGEKSLLPLGIALVELSLAKPLPTLLDLGDGGQDTTLLAILKTASCLIDRVFEESGTDYADVVNSCLSWSSLCLEKTFEERVFDTVVSPLLEDLGRFEGLA